MTANANFVTLGRDEFNFLCRKLSVLEESIADLRREMKRSTTDHGVFHETDSGAGANIDPAVNGRAGGPTHADMHGLHVKDDSVSTSCLFVRFPTDDFCRVISCMWEEVRQLPVVVFRRKFH